ncbi:MAG: DUF2061 domain-containing protein [bacterium]|nr:DUF2061 domain-containing protein [bacterium]
MSINVARESRLRSILKSLSWRITATLTTMIIAYFITGNTHIALKIGGIEVFLKLIIYYFHERVWILIPTGTIRKFYQLFKQEN